MKLNGVGPKVADCVILSGFGHLDAVPVDTHIWKLFKTRYSGKGMTGEKNNLGLAQYRAIGNSMRKIFGRYAGWAQLVCEIFDSQDL